MTSPIPCLRYRDAPRMIDWLVAVLGFHPQMVVEDGAGGIAHAQLARGDGMIMIGSARADAFGALMGTPAAFGGTTACIYLVEPDVDAAHDRAVAAGARIATPLSEKAYGSREFVLLDPEGHLWSVGTYDPFAEAGAS